MVLSVLQYNVDENLWKTTKILCFFKYFKFTTYIINIYLIIIELQQFLKDIFNNGGKQHNNLFLLKSPRKFFCTTTLTLIHFVGKHENEC